MTTEQLIERVTTIAADAEHHLSMRGMTIPAAMKLDSLEQGLEMVCAELNRLVAELQDQA